MNFATRHFVANFTHQSEAFDYVTLGELAAESPENATHRVRAISINEQGGMFGPQAVLTTDHVKINLPSHLNKVVREILASPISVDEINQGIVGFQITQYVNKYGEQHSLRWVAVKADEHLG